MLKSRIDRMVGRRVEIVTTWREKIEGHIVSEVNGEGLFTVRSLGDGGQSWDLHPEDVVSMRPARLRQYQ